MDNNSLSYTRQNCKYHVVFSPKYRRKYIWEIKKRYSENNKRTI